MEPCNRGYKTVGYRLWTEHVVSLTYSHGQNAVDCKNHLDYYIQHGRQDDMYIALTRWLILQQKRTAFLVNHS